jgi:nitroreductase
MTTPQEIALTPSDAFPSPKATLALLKGRRSIRLYRPDPVPQPLVEQLLEAGRWAPSASNRQPWAFIVVRDRALIEQIAQHAVYFFNRWAHVAKAPLLFVLCGNRKSRLYRRFMREDIGLAGGQIMLQAAALGLGTCWIGGLNPQSLAELLDVPPEWEIVGLLTIGFPAEDPPPSDRRPLADLVHYEQFGNMSPQASPTAVRGPRGILHGIARALHKRLR